jgi:hypothetical protein
VADLNTDYLPALLIEDNFGELDYFPGTITEVPFPAPWKPD